MPIRKSQRRLSSDSDTSSGEDKDGISVRPTSREPAMRAKSGTKGPVATQRRSDLRGSLQSAGTPRLPSSAKKPPRSSLAPAISQGTPKGTTAPRGARKRSTAERSLAADDGGYGAPPPDGDRSRVVVKKGRRDRSTGSQRDKPKKLSSPPDSEQETESRHSSDMIARDHILERTIASKLDTLNELKETQAQLRERDDRIRNLETLVDELREGRLVRGSAVTQEDFSDDLSKQKVEEIAVEWLLCLRPYMICRSDQEIRPYVTPFEFCHWAPLAFVEPMHLPFLRKAFVEKRVIQETKVMSEMFDKAFFQQKPVLGLRSAFIARRRQAKSDRVGKKINKALRKMQPAVDFVNGSEWRLETPN